MVPETLAYSFKPDESIDAAIQRIAAEELDSAVDQLEGRGESNRDEAIHEARKNVKKVRGLLRLIRPELGSRYHLENQRLRDAGRKLSDFRDAGAMLEIFDQLSKHYREEWSERPGITSIRDRLMAAKAAHDSDTAVVGQEIRAIREDVKDWAIHRDGFRAIAPGLEVTYRDGRKAMALALREPSPENFHNWRKRVKDHWYHIRLMGRVCGNALAFYQKSLKDLEACLGDDHNLAVLRQKVSPVSDAERNDTDMDLFLFSIENYQSSLRSRAVLLGQDVYEDKPKVFLRQIRSLWQAWAGHLRLEEEDFPPGLASRSRTSARIF